MHHIRKNKRFLACVFGLFLTIWYILYLSAKFSSENGHNLDAYANVEPRDLELSHQRDEENRRSYARMLNKSEQGNHKSPFDQIVDQIDKPDQIDTEDEAENQRERLYKIHRQVKLVSIERGGHLLLAQPHSLTSQSDGGHTFTSVKTHSDHYPQHSIWKKAYFGPDPSVYVLSTLSHTPESLMPEIANGHLGTVGFSHTFYMNGFFMGHYNASHRVALPCTIVRNITSVVSTAQLDKNTNLVLGWRASLDLLDGVLSQTAVGAAFVVEQRFYAHRNFTPLLIHEVDFQRRQGVAEELKLFLPRPKEVSDIGFHHLDHPTEKIYGTQISHRVGRHRTNEDPTDSTEKEVHIFSTPVPNHLIIGADVKRQKFTFIISADVNEDVARHHMLLALELLAAGDLLYLTHVDSWRSVWESGHVTWNSHKSLTPALVATQYYLFSSLPYRPHKGFRPGGMCPGGLAHGGLDHKSGFRGHVYWDQDIWIFPPLLLLHPGSSRSLLDYRVALAKAAGQNALKYGNKGLKYPWESGKTGIELTWDPDNSRYQNHVVGDIALAFQSYILATHDKAYLQTDTSEGAMSVVMGIAEYWLSRTTPVTIKEALPLKKGQKKRKYRTRTQLEIYNAMGPDEYHFPVNNSAYTNAIARLALRAPLLLLNITSASAPDLLVERARNLSALANMVYMPWNHTQRFTPQFDGYHIGEKIKQADTVLLGYPVHEITDLDLIQRNLNIYEKVVAKGPCMTWGMHAIQWMELGETTKAYELFARQLLNTQPPFHVWTEYADGGRTNFMTGAGGFLQSVLHGYLGLRIRPYGLILHPSVLPPRITEIRATDIDYLGNQLDLVMTSVGNRMVLRLTGHQLAAPRLHVTSNNKNWTLVPGKDLELPAVMRYLIRKIPSSSPWPSLVVPTSLGAGERLFDKDVAEMLHATEVRAQQEGNARRQAGGQRRSDAEVDALVEARKKRKDEEHLEKQLEKNDKTL